MVTFNVIAVIFSLFFFFSLSLHYHISLPIFYSCTSSFDSRYLFIYLFFHFCCLWHDACMDKKLLLLSLTVVQCIKLTKWKKREKKKMKTNKPTLSRLSVARMRRGSTGFGEFILRIYRLNTQVNHTDYAIINALVYSFIRSVDATDFYLFVSIYLCKSIANNNIINSNNRPIPYTKLNTQYENWHIN